MPQWAHSFTCCHRIHTSVHMCQGLLNLNKKIVWFKGLCDQYFPYLTDYVQSIPFLLILTTIYKDSSGVWCHSLSPFILYYTGCLSFCGDVWILIWCFMNLSWRNQYSIPDTALGHFSFPKLCVRVSMHLCLQACEPGVN